MGKKRKAAAKAKAPVEEAAQPAKRARGIVLALVVIIVVIAAIWVAKAMAEPDGAPVATSQNGASAPAAASSSATGDDAIWQLDSDRVDVDEIAAAGVPAVIDFGSDSCIPCKQMAPVLKKSNEEMRGRAVVKFVDVWEHADAANGFPVQVIPTQVLMLPGGGPYMPSQSLIDSTGLQFSQYEDGSGQIVFTTHQGALTQSQMDAILEDMGA